MAKRKGTGATGVGAYTTNKSPVTRQDWQDRQGEMGANHDILSNVEKNQHDSGQGDGGRMGPIRYGTDK